MARSPKPLRKHQNSNFSPRWADNTELVGVALELEPLQNCTLYAQYAIGLHAWFLDQVRQSDPVLSMQLHDQQTEKAFTISALEGALQNTDRAFQLRAGQLYHWTITALSNPVAQWLAQWVQQLPQAVELRDAPLQIRQVTVTHSPMTYEQLYPCCKHKTWLNWKSLFPGQSIMKDADEECRLMTFDSLPLIDMPPHSPPAQTALQVAQQAIQRLAT